MHTRFLAALLAPILAGLVIAACANPRATMDHLVYGDPTKVYLGKSKSEIMACAGSPFATYSNAGADTVTYHYDGAGPVPGENETNKKKKDASADAATTASNPFGVKKASKNWKCTASLDFENDKLIRVNFAPHTVVSPYADQKTSKTGTVKKKSTKKPATPVTCTFVLPGCGGAAG